MSIWVFSEDFWQIKLKKFDKKYSELCILPDKTPFSQLKRTDIFLIHHENMLWVFIRNVNEYMYPQDMFSWRNKKKILHETPTSI